MKSWTAANEVLDSKVSLTLLFWTRDIYIFSVNTCGFSRLYHANETDSID